MTDSRTTLVYGATGAQGSAIIKELMAQGRRIRGIGRSAVERGSADENLEWVSADLADADSLARATDGCDDVVFMLPLSFDVPLAERWTANALSAAEVAGVARFVFDTSAPVPDEETGVAAVDLKVRAERLVRASPLSTTIVRPTIYLGNLLAPWSAPGIVQSAVIAYPLPADVPVAWTSWEDAARVVAAALTRRDLGGATLNVRGADLIDGNALAAAFTKALGRNHSYAPIPLEGFEAGLNAAMGSPVGTEIARLYGWFAQGGGAHLAPGLKDVEALHLTPTGVTEWISSQEWATGSRSGAQG